MEFARQKYWSGVLFPTPGDLPTPRSNLSLLCLLLCQADSSPLCYLGRPICGTAVGNNTSISLSELEICRFQLETSFTVKILKLTMYVSEVYNAL